MKFLKKLEALDPELADEARAEMEKHEAYQPVVRAKRNLVDTINRYSEDATGQDGEEEIEAAAEDYTDSQNDYIKRTDPDRYAEMRYFGQL